ncbi:MAG: hypothetical protein GY771_07135 [bacterium]|nr:hypothetical protein [bacterium]
MNTKSSVSLFAGFLAVFIGTQFLFTSIVLAQDDFVPKGETYIIREPAAWTRAKGEFSLQMGMEPLFVRAELGILDYLTAGISYGGVNMLGYDEPELYPRPYFQVRFRITNGGMFLPAISVGYDDQGQGRFIGEERIASIGRDWNRFQIKAKGFYAVASQEYELLGPFGIHLGVNYNAIENNDEDRHPNVFAAIEMGLGQHIMLVGTYDAAINDNGDESFGDGFGFLNAGVRWRVVEEFNIEFYLMNLLENQNETLPGDEGGLSRMLMITYKGSF